MPPAHRAPGRLRRLSGSTRGRAGMAGVGLLVAAGVAVALALSGGGSPRRPAAVRTVMTSPPSTTTSTTAPRAAGNDCPLTDTPAPGGKVPRRPALLVKIGNEPEGARPQSGLNEADIVFDTPAEGFIMRYVAVYQCESASAIGPTRSLRWVDWNMIARQFVSPILAFAGGINPNVDGLAATSWISGANLLEGAQDAAERISSRVPPDNLYTSTSALYGLFPSKTSPPPPVFDYSTALPPGSTPAASIGIDFSAGTDPVWKWDPSSHLWLHTYSGSPDVDTLTGDQVTTTNVVVEIVHYSLGPYIESTGGTGDVESDLLGSGPGYVLRDGRSVKVTWHRADELAKTTFTDSAGKPVDLAPGRTWVEIDPDVQADAPGGITVTP